MTLPPRLEPDASVPLSPRPTFRICMSFGSSAGDHAFLEEIDSCVVVNYPPAFGNIPFESKRNRAAQMSVCPHAGVATWPCNGLLIEVSLPE